ncbi:BTAD domain-containing putative transcriptional regulator [Nocardiopsis sediminis]|uniref:BTAD domain-containing putative transcriptional regulator n=1 Tax=Nocardiopsis sediminis TaxID=1778267 RepID=A0ABV8FGM9_9ACTN
MSDISFAVLGPLTVQAGDTPVRLQGNKRRVLLATLLLRANRTVPIPELVQRVWGDVDPSAYRSALQVQVTRLRAVLCPPGPGAPAGAAPKHGPPLLVSGRHGYRIELDERQLDLARFRRLAAAAGRAEADGDLAGCCDRLARALELWQGPVLHDVASDGLHERDVAALLDELLRAAEHHGTVALALGRHERVADALSGLTASHPHREALVGQRMVALYRCGRASEALEVYGRTRRFLADRLGTDPGRGLQEVFHAVLRGDLDDRPLVPRQRTVYRPPVVRARLVPAELPADPPGFVGRSEELASLDRLFASGPSSARRALVSGPQGAGCTALAVHWAHAAAAGFPDGQLYVDLRGAGAGPRSAFDVLRRFLRSLGVKGALPPDTDERAALLRSVLAGRRVLMVLDNAHSAEQVRPLLPGAPGCGAVVTSRYWLVDLIVREGVPALAIGELLECEAVTLLRDLVGARRAAAEPGALRRLAEAVERLPLPLRLAAAWLATHPEARIAALAGKVERRCEDSALARLKAVLGGDPRFLMGGRRVREGSAWRE